MRRVSVVGNSGSGKSTLGRALGERLGVPYLEIDSIAHQAGWERLPAAEMLARVDAATSGDGWIIDGNYRSVQPLIWSRADTVVWLDLPRPLVMRQVIGRTLRRVGRREELWNGNRETWRNFFTLNPEESVILWSWRKHGHYRERYTAAMADPGNEHLAFVRLRSRAEVRALVTAGNSGTAEPSY